MRIARGTKPEFKIIQEPQEGYPDYLVADVHLPKVVGLPDYYYYKVMCICQTSNKIIIIISPL